jgi:uncharacterized repeat protein (TIGR03847 family)
MPSFDFDAVDHLTFAAVGEPGSRVFLLQAANATNVMTLKLEKSQVRSMCAYIKELLEGLGRPGHLPEDHELREPYEISWVAGPIAVHYDEALERIIIDIESLDAIDADVLETPATARIACTREQGADLIINGTSLVESGRPPCPLCGFPLDPSGHACPRTNGNRPPAL